MFISLMLGQSGICCGKVVIPNFRNLIILSVDQLKIRSIRGPTFKYSGRLSLECSNFMTSRGNAMVQATRFKYQARIVRPHKASLKGNRHKSTACHYFNGSRFEEGFPPSYDLTPFHYRPVSTHS